ncbi:hypothetical protein KIW84_057251 [Lathyrus oleraceus]|uniref:Uncharacterized protein n=1 Tax=Pisum sativum TaxID=3888 RepID=A0A9D5AHW2_PEA|nr:hypothetical protein KIW84_057251 [Pisum sativum]
MAPPKNSKGKGKMGEGSNALDSDPEYFQFPAMLEYQGVVDFVSDSGLFYQDFFRYFYAYFTILPGCAFSSTVRGIDISMSLEDVGACLGVPSEGERISHGFTPDTEG